MSHPILSTLQARPEGADLDQIVQATGLTQEYCWAALMHLTLDGWVVGIARVNQPPIFHAITSIGECEWCGLDDHHLVAHTCPRCMQKSSGLEVLPSTPLRVHLPRKPQPFITARSQA